MKTVEDLKKHREKVKAEIDNRNSKTRQIIIGMGTCGIAAGARHVMKAVEDEVAKRNFSDVQIRKTSCIGMCEKEVLLDIVRPNEPRVTYGLVKPEDVPKIIDEHLVNGRIVSDLVVGKF